MTRVSPRTLGALLVLAWIAAAFLLFVILPNTFGAFIVLSASIVGLAVVWEIRARGLGDQPIYLLVFGPLYLVLVALQVFFERHRDEHP